METGKLTYNAKKLLTEYNDKIVLPSIEDVIKNILFRKFIALKKQEIDEIVCQEIDVKMDNSISSAVAVALKNLESNGDVSHVSHGMWKCIIKKL